MRGGPRKVRIEHIGCQFERQLADKHCRWLTTLSLGTAVVPWWEQNEQSSKAALAMLGFPGSAVAALPLSAVAATSCTFPPEQTSTQSAGEPPDAARAGIRTGMSECSSNASIATSDTFQRSRRRASMRTSIDEAPVPDKGGGITTNCRG